MYCEANKAGVAAGGPSFSIVEDLLTANSNELDPTFHQTIQEITANINEVIDEKLGALSQTLQAHTQELKRQLKTELLKLRTVFWRWIIPNIFGL